MMYRKYLTIALLLPWVTTLFIHHATAQSAASVQAVEIRVSGLVIDRKKYSFTLQTLDRNYEVKIPNGTPMLMKLTKPQIDLAGRKIQVVLMQSAADGKPVNDTVLSWPLANPTFVSTTFDDEKQMKRVMDQQVKLLDRFVVSPAPFDRSPLSFGGELEESRKPGQFLLNDNGRVQLVKLGTRRGLLGGFAITDLKPLQTSVWVQGRMDGETVLASRIRLEYLGDAQAGFDDSLPNLLSLGDVTSYDYHRPLIEALAGKVNLHHPPAWTGPSRNWVRLHHYVGVLDSETPTWDVITFNYGIRDDSEPREEYQQNLRDAIGVLKRTGARLVWVNSTPIPNGFSAGDPNQPLKGRVRGRMDLQNRWAADVLKEYPDIVVCDLWKVVKDDEQDVYTHWWSGNWVNFDYKQSIPLGRTVAKAVLTALGSAQELNPLSAHSSADSISSSR